MRILILILSLILFSPSAFTQPSAKNSTKKNNLSDTVKIIKLNEAAFNNRLKNPEYTIRQASKALLLASQLEYDNGIAESYRVIGVGKYYLNNTAAAIESYLMALKYFRESKNLVGEAKVYNNIGNLYRDIDNDKSLENFSKALEIAEKLNAEELIAGLHLNIGTVNQRKKDYPTALSYYKRSLAMFSRLKNQTGIIQSRQNIGLVYYNTKQYDIAEKYLNEARNGAKRAKLDNTTSSIDLTLSAVFVEQGCFDEAQALIAEGSRLAKLVKNSKLEYDFLLSSYELEAKRKNYQGALHFLRLVYQQDSITYKNNVSDKISLLEAQHRQLEKQRENELTIAQQNYTRILFWASTLVAVLAFFVIFLLIRNVRKSALINEELTRLNEEVSRQKDDLDHANQNLEAIIADRTKDLQIKNKKLSEYSSHLSHQIRGPVATFKGLLLLEKDDLIDNVEFVEQLTKCVNDLDDKIININENLNNPDIAGFFEGK